MLVVLAIIMFVRVAYLRLRSRMTQSWKPITAVITHAQVEERQVQTRYGQVTEYRPDITYVYTLGGKDHAGSRVHPAGDYWSRSQSVAAAPVARYTPGARVLAHYNPAKPDQAVLTREVPQIAFRESLIGVASLLGAAVLYKLNV